MDQLQAAIFRARSCSYPVEAPEIRPVLTEALVIQAPAPKPIPKPIPDAVRIFRLPVGDIAKIQTVVAEYYGLTVMDLTSARREAPVVTARHVAIWLSKKLTPMSLPQIGRKFGNRDHTTVLHAIQRITERMKSDCKLAAEVADLQARIDL